MARSLTCVGVQDRLDAYLAESLGLGERAGVERHLAECASCRRELAFLRSLLADATSLPRALTPERDLWPEIEERLDAAEGRTTKRWRWMPLAAAAVLLVAVSAAVAVMLVRDPQARDLATMPPEPAPAVAVMAVEAQYTDAVAELQAALQIGRDVLDPKTLAVIEESLRLIDVAIAEARAALAADPANADLAQRLGSSYALKVDLLRRAARLAAEI